MASSSGSTATLGERLGRGDNGASDGAKESVFFPPAGRPGKVWLESSESTTVGIECKYSVVGKPAKVHTY